MLSNNRCFSKQSLFLIIVFYTILGLSGCTASSTPVSVEPISQNNLALIQQNGNLSVRLFGIMDFDYSEGNIFRIPSELAVSGVPLVWMGANFKGNLEKTTKGEDVTDEVHGSLSVDGNWIESIYYSRKTLRANGSETFYRVNIQNLPLNYTANVASSNLGNFEKYGADIQKYITRIEYMEGLVKDGQVDSRIKYLSTDWKNNAQGQTPLLKLTFARGGGNGGQNTKSGM
jgi:hypothetical protein